MLRSLHFLPPRNKILYLNLAYQMVKNTLEYVHNIGGEQLLMVNITFPTTPRGIIEVRVNKGGGMRVAVVFVGEPKRLSFLLFLPLFCSSCYFHSYLSLLLFLSMRLFCSEQAVKLVLDANEGSVALAAFSHITSIPSLILPVAQVLLSL